MTPRILAALLLLAVPCSAAAGDPYREAAGALAGALPAGAMVCVLPFSYIGAEGSRGGLVVAERLNTELVRDGRLTVLERSQVSKVLDGLKLPAAGLAAAEGSQKAGRLLGADLVISGTLAKLAGGGLEFNARAIDPGTGEVKASARAAVKEDWLETMPEAPADAAGAKAYALCKEGMYALDARRFAEAEELFTKAMAEEANAACGMNIPGMALMARSMARQGKAGPQDDAPEETGPPTWLTIKEQRRVSAGAAENEKKLARYAALLKAMPDNAAAYFERGSLLAKMRRYREARRDLDAAVRLDSGKARYFSVRAYALSMLGFYDDAVRDYTAALGLEPGRSDDYNGRGNMYKTLVQYDKALADYGKAIELDPGEPVYYANRAGCLAMLRRWKEALKDCDKAVELDPDFAEGHCRRGEVLLSLKRYGDAVKDFDKALRLAPGYAPAVRGRQEALDRKSGKYEGYTGDSDKAVELFNARETD